MFLFYRSLTSICHVLNIVEVRGTLQRVGRLNLLVDARGPQPAVRVGRDSARDHGVCARVTPHGDRQGDDGQHERHRRHHKHEEQDNGERH